MIKTLHCPGEPFGYFELQKYLTSHFPNIRLKSQSKRLKMSRLINLREITPPLNLVVMDDCMANTDKTMELILTNPLIRKIYFEGRYSDLMDEEKWRRWIQQCEQAKREQHDREVCNKN